MKHKQIAMMMIITMCLTTFFITKVAAESNTSAPSEEIIAKQAEIDKYLFEEYSLEIA